LAQTVEDTYEAFSFTVFPNVSADSVQQPHVQQPYMYAKPEAANAVLGSW